MVEEKAFDKGQLRHLETGLKNVVNMNYDLCMHQCNEKKFTDEKGCKQGCYNDILVPFNMLKHQARSPEDVLYKQCLASKFPNIQQSDYITCTNQIYADRAEILMRAFATQTKNTIERLRD